MKKKFGGSAILPIFASPKRKNSNEDDVMVDALMAQLDRAPDYGSGG